MREQPSTGKKRSYFKVLVNLDEHENAEAAVQAARRGGAVEACRNGEACGLTGGQVGQAKGFMDG